jgi:hypothetical protein
MLYTIIGIVHLVLWIWALVDILKSSKPPAEKLLWVVVVALLPLIGLILYLVIGRG